MGNLAEAMAKTVQQIQAAAQTRRAHISQLQHTTQEFLQACQVADQHRSDDLRHLASDLKRQMKNTEKARLDAAQEFVQETRRAIHDIGVSVSELHSDTHNLVQRFAMEHQDMAQQLHRSLAADTRARLDITRRRAGRDPMSLLRVFAKVDHEGKISLPTPTSAARLFLNTAYLVAKSQASTFADCCQALDERLASQGARLVRSGPWPPYHFSPRLD